MAVLISNVLPVAVSKLNATDAKRVWDFLAKFMANPAQPGISLERIDNAKDKKLWSGRISRSLRAVIHQDGDTWTILYASQHDDAYNWASTKKLERHPATGALQIVESPEVVAEQVTISDTVLPRLFDAHADDYLLSLGVPPSWLPTIRKIQSEDVLLDILEKLPEEVSERLLNLASGELVTPPAPIPKNQPVTKSKDTKRRFFVLEDNADILRMLEAPLATWLVFLHPSQRKLALGTFNGPVKITGSAGTGKTVVALHRARHLARQGKRVLLTSFVSTICQNLERNLKVLCTPEELAKIQVASVHSVAMKLVNSTGKQISPVDDAEIQKLIQQYYQSSCPLNIDLLFQEWQSIIQAQGITNWNEYRTANRSGRGYALNVKDRQKVWQVFERVLETLQSRNEIDWSGLCRISRELVVSGQVESSFDAVIVDEVQDLKPQEMHLLKTLAGSGADRLTLVGDGGQRIYAGGFSLNALGIDVRGRSHILRINYRTTEQILNLAERILGEKSDNLDGSQEKRRGTVSLLKGPEPILKGFQTQRQQSDFVVERIKKILDEGSVDLDEIAIFARTNKLVGAMEQSLTLADIPYRYLNSQEETETFAVNLGTMHRAKGLEFKIVFVINVSEGEVPLSYAIKKVTDTQAKEEAIAREQQLLYVSMTRARDEVFILWVGQPSRFLEKVMK